MFNYTKMELNRIFRMKSMIVALFLMALWILANGIILQRFDVYGILGEDAEMYMAMAEEGEDSTMSEQMSEGFEAGFNAGFEIGAAEAEAEEDVEEEEYDFSQILSGGMYEEATVEMFGGEKEEFNKFDIFSCAKYNKKDGKQEFSQEL